MSERPGDGLSDGVLKDDVLKDDVLNRSVSMALAVASSAAVALMVAGLVAWLASGAPAPPGGAVGTTIVGRLGRLDAEGLISMGLVLVAVTPLAHVAAAALSFVRMGESRYALLSGAVLAAVVASVVTAAALARPGN